MEKKLAVVQFFVALSEGATQYVHRLYLVLYC